MADDRDHHQEEEDIKDSFRSMMLIGVCLCLVAGAVIGYIISILLAKYLFH